MKNVFGLVVFLGIWGCIEHRPEQRVIKKKKPTENEFIADKTYSGLRIYTGKIPCADCSAIEQRLVLKGDSTGIYRLIEVYKDATEDGDAEIISSGEWRKTRNPNFGSIFYLSQNNIGDSTRILRYQIEKGKINLLSQDSTGMNSKFNYTLRLVRYVAP